MSAAGAGKLSGRLHPLRISSVSGAKPASSRLPLVPVAAVSGAGPASLSYPLVPVAAVSGAGPASLSFSLVLVAAVSGARLEHGVSFQTGSEDSPVRCFSWETFRRLMPLNVIHLLFSSLLLFQSFFL